METAITEQQIDNLANRVAQSLAVQLSVNTKDILTLSEASKYLGLSKSQMYQLTMKKQIPYYRPTGKKCYFDRMELNRWLKRNRCATDDELNDMAQEYCQKGGEK